MAGALKEKQLVRHVYAELQAVSCPLVEGLYLQEADGMLQLLCVPSQHRTDILAWICSSVNPNFANSKTMAVRSSGPDVLTKEIAGLGQELMLCRADDLDLIRGEASPHRQLLFLEQLLTLVPGCKKSAGNRLDQEMLLNELFTDENLPLLTQMLKPTLDPWPAHIKALRMGSKSSLKPSREEAADVAALLQLTQSTLQQLQSQCEFLSSEPQSPGVFSPSSLRVAACDLQLLMATFSHVFETDLRANCSRDAPSFSAEAEVFQRTHRLLLASITELEMLKEVSDASVSMTEEVNQLQTQPYYWSRGEKRKFSDQLEELTRRVQDLFPLLLSLDLGPKNPPNIS
ncbi:HAUS augmin-like complex subunit 7 isoform X1 [Cyclopterus lumpus]|uniref:HAUS augmin-like complex, subunit 7 n=1 Tax=Cyclopterus lumpus TaxID=8103 RepID=A0A8C3ARN2_CYCLU|nr:HAUS augmin-like complex subunit 7 isoform X1 [Cyclopterus lumpus]